MPLIIRPDLMIIDGGDVAPITKKTTTPAPTPVPAKAAVTPATVNTTTAAGIAAASAQPVPGVKVATAPVAPVVPPAAITPTSVPVTTPVVTPVKDVVEKPDPTKTPYTDLTPAQRAAMTSKEKTDYLKAARTSSMAADAEARAASDPMLDFSNRPSAPQPDPNFIQYYSWIGGVNSGEWKLYRAPNTPENQASYGSRTLGGVTQATSTSAVGANGLKNGATPVYGPDGAITSWNVQGTGGGGTGGGGTGGGGTGGGAGGTGNSPVIDTGAPTTNIDVLKAALRGLGFTSAIIDSSTSFLNGLLKDGLDYDNTTEVFLNSKEYTLKNGTKMTSPFYTEYGYLNDGLVVPKSASDLFNSVEGYKGIVDKYKLSTKYLSQDNLKLYVKNDVTVADLSERAAAAQLRAVEADPFQIKALMAQGYIASASDLTDFYMDAKIGKEQLELNRQTGVFTAEALRRAQSGISSSAAQLAGFKQLTATLAGKGYSEAQISQLASTGFENIAQTLDPLAKYAGIYQKVGGTEAANAEVKSGLQSELLREEFQGTASERRKLLTEQNQRAFQGTSGTTTGSLRSSGTAGII